MTETQQVVVVVKPYIQYDKVVNKYTARIPELGLTGYADSREKALAKVKKLYASWVHAHRWNNDLIPCLSRSSLRWWLLEDYEGELEIEYIKLAKSSRKKEPEVRVRGTQRDVQIDNSQEYLLAA